MSSITPIAGAPQPSARPAPGQPDPASAAPASGRSLVAVTCGIDGGKPVLRQRPLAAFVAQLIANAQQAPQTRQRRRAEPEEAVAVYLGGAAPAATPGRTLQYLV